MTKESAQKSGQWLEYGAKAALLAALYVLGGKLGFMLAQGCLLPCLCLPFLIWAAFRFGSRGTTIVVPVPGVMVLWGTMRGISP